jgi:hypothetical protein
MSRAIARTNSLTSVESGVLQEERFIKPLFIFHKGKGQVLHTLMKG